LKSGGFMPDVQIRETVNMSDNFVNCIKSFIDAPCDYRPATMWFWNDDIKEEEITFQLEKFLEQGIYDFFVNAVWGTTIEYLSPRYFELVKHTVKEAKRLGMRYWIYDEFNWPSGVAGGYLLKEEPWTRGKILHAAVEPVFPGRNIKLKLEGEFVAAQLVYDGDPRSVVDITSDVDIEMEDDGFVLNYQSNSPVDSVIYIFHSCLQKSVLAAAMWGKYSWNQEGYVDTFNPEAIKRFLDYTHEKYKEAVGDEFGKTVVGVFTDEVCVSSPFDLGEGRIPWSDNFRDEFIKKYGYDIVDYLYALFAKPASTDELKARFNFWRLVAELLRRNYIDQAYNWCDKNGLLYTGHFDGEESLVWHMYQSGDIFELIENMHVPGIDSIFSRDRVDDENFNIAGKILNSAARFFDRSRTLCETYTGSSWKLRLDEMRRIANRLLVLGVNMIQYMGSYYSLDGGRKGMPLCYPPTHSYNNPLFRHYGSLGESISRTAYLSGQTKGCGRILVLLPQAAVYELSDTSENLFNYQKDSFSVNKYDRTVFGTVNALLELNIEFDIGYEGMADEVEISNGIVSFRGCQYDCVILPMMGYCTSGVASMAREIADSGVKTIFINEIPEKEVDTGNNTGLAQAFGLEEQLKYVQDGAYNGTRHNIWLIKAEKVNRSENGEYKKALLNVLGEEYIVLNLKHDGGIYSCHRRNKDMDVFFIANDRWEPVKVSGQIPEGMHAIFLDPDTGERWDVPLKDAGIFDVELNACEIMVIVCIKDCKMAGEAQGMLKSKPRVAMCFENAFSGDVLKLADGWSFEAEGGNILMPSYKFIPGSIIDDKIAGNCIDGELERLLDQLDEKDLIQCYGCDFPGGLGIAFGSRYAVLWEFYIDELPPKLSLFIETGELRSLYLNGIKIDGQIEKVKLWGINNGSVDVTSVVRKGYNKLLIVAEMPKWAMPHKIPTSFLYGEFLVDEGRIISKRTDIKPLPWNNQGYPYFSGNGIYRTDVQINCKFSKALIRLDTQDAVNIFVNGKLAAKRLWPPYEADITEFLREGDNRIELEFTSTYANLMGCPMDSGLYNPPEIILFEGGDGK